MNPIHLHRLPGLALAVLLAHTVGCSTHPVHFSYPTDSVYVAQIPLSVGYHADEDAMGAVWSDASWAASSGIGYQVFGVPYARIVDEHVRSVLGPAFRSFEYLPAADLPQPGPEALLTVDVPEYSVEGYRAHITISIRMVDRQGNLLFEGSRKVRGPSFGRSVRARVASDWGNIAATVALAFASGGVLVHSPGGSSGGTVSAGIRYTTTAAIRKGLGSLLSQIKDKIAPSVRLTIREEARRRRGR